MLQRPILLTSSASQPNRVRSSFNFSNLPSVQTNYSNSDDIRSRNVPSSLVSPTVAPATSLGAPQTVPVTKFQAFGVANSDQGTALQPTSEVRLNDESAGVATTVMSSSASRVFTATCPSLITATSGAGSFSGSLVGNSGQSAFITVPLTNEPAPSIQTATLQNYIVRIPPNGCNVQTIPAKSTWTLCSVSHAKQAAPDAILTDTSASAEPPDPGDQLSAAQSPASYVAQTSHQGQAVPTVDPPTNPLPPVPSSEITVEHFPDNSPIGDENSSITDNSSIVNDVFMG